MTCRAIVSAEIFDGVALHDDSALLIEQDTVQGIVPTDAIPAGYEVDRIAGSTILPGFVDLQVNGGGGLMFNDATTVDGLRTIAEANASTGTVALLPTLITDTPERTRAAIDAVEAAIRAGVPGIVGLHLEGPHLSVARKGAHDPSLIRPMEKTDEALLIDAAQRLPTLMVTLAPETVRPDQIARLVRGGVVVSLGHSDCSYDQARAAFAAGATCVTHLFNAMSPLGHRAPGLVGAALVTGGVSAGLIADGIHVHTASMQAALAAKHGPGRVFLVTDAMATLGSDIDAFSLNTRRVLRRDGRLTLEDGTLAGADLTFPTALRVVIDRVGIDRASAYAMATEAPAALLRARGGLGRIAAGEPLNAILLDASGAFLRRL